LYGLPEVDSPLSYYVHSYGLRKVDPSLPFYVWDSWSGFFCLSIYVRIYGFPVMYVFFSVFLWMYMCMGFLKWILLCLSMYAWASWNGVFSVFLRKILHILHR
jgi:hypothetical protein